MMSPRYRNDASLTPADVFLTRDEIEAEAGRRQRACLCAPWELAALGRCVCPLANAEQEGVEPCLQG